MICDAPKTYTDVNANCFKTMIEFLIAQKKLHYALGLLHSTCDILSRHQCPSRKLEIAFLQENNKLAEVIQVNRALKQKIQELQNARNDMEWHENSFESKTEISRDNDDCLTQRNESFNAGFGFDAEEVERLLRPKVQGAEPQSTQNKQRRRKKDKLKEFTRSLLSSYK